MALSDYDRQVIRNTYQSLGSGFPHTVRRLNFQLKQLCKTHRDGSYGTQLQRERVLTLIANQLHALGYRQLSARSLKPKHIETLIEAWLESGIGVGTIKNRMAAIR